MAIVTQSDGTVSVGTIDSESEKALTLKLPDGRKTEVAKDSIVNRQSTPSTMPPVYADGLSPSDLRDLIAYLDSLRDAENAPDTNAEVL